MREHEILDIALENLQKNAGITGNWIEHGNMELDGSIELIVENKNTFAVEIESF